MKPPRPSGPQAVRLIQVIEIEVAVGVGADDDPIRPVKQYWSMDGEKLAVCDPYLELQAASGQ